MTLDTEQHVWCPTCKACPGEPCRVTEAGAGLQRRPRWRDVHAHESHRARRERGRKVRIAFKPRGQNVGWRYVGFVRDARGREVWADRVCGTLGARGLLRRAGLLPSPDTTAEETP